MLRYMKRKPRYPDLWKQAEQQIKAAATKRDSKTDRDFATAWRYAMICSKQGLDSPFEE